MSNCRHSILTENGRVTLPGPGTEHLERILRSVRGVYDDTVADSLIQGPVVALTIHCLADIYLVIIWIFIYCFYFNQVRIQDIVFDNYF